MKKSCVFGVKPNEKGSLLVPGNVCLVCFMKHSKMYKFLKRFIHLPTSVEESKIRRWKPGVRVPEPPMLFGSQDKYLLNTIIITGSYFN